jgi:hypothetical protein
MIDSKNKVLKNILDSANGLHLTIYIKFDGNILNFRRKLTALLETPTAHLESVLTPEQLNKFLAPIEALARDNSLLKKMRGNIGVFRKNDLFRCVSLPIEIEETSVVADTFHIKPLLKWAQTDQEFLLIGLKYEGATLYKGTQSDFRKIDEAVYPEALRRYDDDGGYVSLKERRQQRAELQHTMEWLSLWVKDLTKNTKTTVFLAGSNDVVKAFIKNYQSAKLYPETIDGYFSENKAIDIIRNIRMILRLDSQIKISDSLNEFELAKNLKHTKTNIFQIARAALKGNVRKLVVAEDFSVFGKLDKHSGGVAIHATDMDHEDDCLLDDLAQTVLLNGGEVIVAKKSDIPNGKVIMAILNNEQIEIHDSTFRKIEAAV